MSGPLTAIAFLTRIPLTRRSGLDGDSLSRSAAWFPIVGLVVGAIMGGTRALAGLALNPTASTAIAVLATVIATGALHEDGLADTADAAGAHVSHERKREILHDPRVGTYGALALIFAVVVPIALLAPLDDPTFLKVAVTAHVLSRWSALPLAAAARRDRLAGSAAQLRISPVSLVAGTAGAAAVAVVAVGPVQASATIVICSGVGALGAAVSVRAFGAANGDVFGAVNKLVELAAYAALGAFWT